MFRRILPILGIVAVKPLHLARSLSSSEDQSQDFKEKLLQNEKLFNSSLQIFKRCLKENPNNLDKCRPLAEKLTVQLRNPEPFDTTKKFQVHDMHHPAEIVGTADTLDEAMKIVAADMIKNVGRCYDVFEESEGTKKSVWFGDSWSVGQYFREKGMDPVVSSFIEKHNVRRMALDVGLDLESQADPEEPNSYRMRFKP